MSGNEGTGVDRRALIAGASALAALGGAEAPAATAAAAERYGLIGALRAKPGQGAALAAVLIEGTKAMPGCLGYTVAIDSADGDRLWVCEVWDSKASHDASLALPAVRAAIAEGRPLIAGFDSSVATRVLGGIGLAAAG